MARLVKPPSGHVFRVDRARGPVWYVKYRLPDGRQIQRKIGPAWTERGRPPTGYFTKRTAEAWLRDLLDQARHGTLPGQTQTGATFDDAATEWLRYVEHDRGREPSRVAGYRTIVRSSLLPAFGSMPLESITAETIEAWLTGLGGGRELEDEGARSDARHLPASAEGLVAAVQSGRRCREAAAAPERRDPGVLA